VRLLSFWLAPRAAPFEGDPRFEGARVAKMRPIDFCHPSLLLRALTSRGFPVRHRGFHRGQLIDGPVALLALPVPNPTSPGILAFHDALIASVDRQALKWWAFSARHVPDSRTSGIPVATLARPAGTWLSPSPDDSALAAKTASTPPSVKRTTLSRPGMPSSGKRPSKIRALASTVHSGLHR